MLLFIIQPSHLRAWRSLFMSYLPVWIGPKSMLHHNKELPPFHRNRRIYKGLGINVNYLAYIHRYFRYDNSESPDKQAYNE